MFIRLAKLLEHHSVVLYSHAKLVMYINFVQNNWSVCSKFLKSSKFSLMLSCFDRKLKHSFVPQDGGTAAQQRKQPIDIPRGEPEIVQNNPIQRPDEPADAQPPAVPRAPGTYPV